MAACDVLGRSLIQGDASGKQNQPRSLPQTKQHLLGFGVSRPLEGAGSLPLHLGGGPSQWSPWRSCLVLAAGEPSRSWEPRRSPACPQPPPAASSPPSPPADVRPGAVPRSSSPPCPVDSSQGLAQPRRPSRLQHPKARGRRTQWVHLPLAGRSSPAWRFSAPWPPPPPMPSERTGATHVASLLNRQPGPPGTAFCPVSPCPLLSC